MKSSVIIWHFILFITSVFAFPIGNKNDPSAVRDSTLAQAEYLKLTQSYHEISRRYRRSYFTAGDWIRSRRSDRIVNNILTIPQSGLFRDIQQELTLITSISVFVNLWNVLLVEGYKGFDGVMHPKLVDASLPLLTLPLPALTVSVSALGLLLTFKTNVCFKRWDEARKAWGKVINDSRSIVRMGCTWAKHYENIDDASLQRLGEAVCSFSRALQNRVLTPEEDGESWNEYLDTRITDQEYAQKLRDAKHKPTCTLAEISRCLVDFQLNPIHQVEVELVVTGLCDALGASERIFTSPVPTFYGRHLVRFLALWLSALPLTLYGPFSASWNHWGMIPATILISSFMLGIEELGNQMEEPFSILPMEKMCEGSIRTPVMEQVERSKEQLSRKDRVTPFVAKQDASANPLVQTPDLGKVEADVMSKTSDKDKEVDVTGGWSKSFYDFCVETSAIR